MTILRKSARGQSCTIRRANCRWQPEYTVLAHENGAGIGLKHSDIRAAFACDKCHSEYDQRTPENAAEIERDFYRGVMETLQYWMDNGYISIQRPPKSLVSNFEEVESWQ